MREARRTVRRSRIVDWRGDPSLERRRQLEPVGRRDVGHRELIRRLKRADIIEPHNVTVTVIDLRAVLIERGDVVRRQVPVRDCVRVIGIRFVHMLRRKRRRQREPGRQNEGDGNAAEPVRHAFAIMGWSSASRQTPFCISVELHLE